LLVAGCRQDQVQALPEPLQLPFAEHAAPPQTLEQKCKRAEPAA